MPSAFPNGTILAWNENKIPSGYTLCNGNNGSPNLIGKMIIGAGNSYSAGTIGGSMSSGTSWSGTISGTPKLSETTLTIGQIASHMHNGWRNTFISGGNGSKLLPVYTESMGAGTNAVATRDSSLASIGGSKSHTHTLTNVSLGSTTATKNINILPPYYALCYIMVTDGTDSHSLVPSGVIVPWSGAQNDIPKGWVLYKKLQDRFLYGSTTAKSSGGSPIPTVTTTATTSSCSSSTVSIGNSHSHGHYGNVTKGSYKLPYSSSSGGTALAVKSGTSVEGAGTTHSHNISGINNINIKFQDTLPAYYALCYIQKI